MKGVVVGCVLLAGCFVASPVMRFGGGKSAKESQHEEAEKLTPPGLVVDSEWGGEVRTAKIRVWADDDFRAQNVHWQRTFDDELAYANQVLAATFGVRLVPEYHEWQRHAPGATLDDGLAELAAADPGDGVLTVVGLTSSLGLVTATFEQLGVAHLSGNHMIVRGYADVEERHWFERAFHDLEPGEREAMYTARRRHKTTALLLHELGHNLGAPHSYGDTLMSAIYSDRASSFDKASHDAILATLDTRLHRTPERPAPTTAAADPHVMQQPAPPQHATLVIALDDAGKPIIGGQVIDDATLDELLHRTAADDPDTEVIVRTRPRTPHAAVKQAFAHARGAGLQHVGMESAP